MDWRRLREKPFFVPVAGSLALHLLFAAIAMGMTIHSNFEVPAEDFLKFNMKSADSRPLLKQDRQPASPDRALQRKKSAVKAADLLRDDLVHEQLPRRVEIVENIHEPIPRPIVPADRAELDEREKESILTITEEKRLKEQVAPKQKTVSPVQEALKFVRAHRAQADDLLTTVQLPMNRMRLGPSGVADTDPDEGMPGFTPAAGSVGNADLSQGLQEGAGQLLKYETLDEFLDIEVTTYEVPAETQKYFMVKIFAKKDVKAFKVMPKEVVFAVDCSLSISPDRLEEFKKGVRYCLEHLGPGDVFNIVSFKEKAGYFSAKSLKATPQTIKEAERYILGLTSDQRTNVYSAFKAIVQSPLGRTPSDIMLLSDGRPTFGIVDSRELINSITRANGSVRPVFVFSGGAKVNRYLLDFIAYQNRGWSQFTKRRGDIGKGLAEFYDKIRDPIFLNLRFQLQGLNQKEVYPKSLPDFYRNAEFVIYGTFDKEDRFSMRLLGDVDGKTKELIFSRSLKESPKGTQEIMRGWAFNKIYYLISQMISRPNQDPKLLAEIHRLSKQYQVTTPYSPELENFD